MIRNVTGLLFLICLAPALMFGAIGYVFRKLDIPVAPMVLSLVLGGILEQSFRQAMTISGANPATFVGSTICVVQVILTIISIFMPIVLNRMKSLRGAADEAA